MESTESFNINKVCGVYSKIWAIREARRLKSLNAMNMNLTRLTTATAPCPAMTYTPLRHANLSKGILIIVGAAYEKPPLSRGCHST